MGNIPFTRDEAILALDVLYSANGLRLNMDSEEITELSKLLNELPIIPISARGEIFRNKSGIINQLYNFNSSYKKGEKGKHVGFPFYEVADEFYNKKDELHKIACAIRQNRAFFQTMTFGSKFEEENFPEGALLGHLHRVLEARDGKPVLTAERCEICKLNLAEVYKPISGDFLQRHLAVPITELDGSRHYNDLNFITVCPNCHAVLHQRRPWVTRNNMGDILA